MTATSLDLGPRPRLLFLSEDPSIVARQLAGERMGRAATGSCSPHLRPV